MPKFTRKKAIAVVTTALVLGISGTAYAYWTQMGAGTGTAGTGNTVALVVKQTNTVTGLYPGGAAQALSGTLDNPNAGSIKVGAVTATVTATDKGVNCLTSWYSISGTGAATPVVVPSGNAQAAWTGLTVAMVNDPAVNQDVCKGAAITITYAVAAA